MCVKIIAEKVVKPILSVVVDDMRPSGVSATHVYFPASEIPKQSMKRRDLVDPTRKDDVSDDADASYTASSSNTF